MDKYGDKYIKWGITYMLIGEYRHTIDTKKRMALPARFRKELGTEVVITTGLDNCLAVYPLKEWEAGSLYK